MTMGKYNLGKSTTKMDQRLVKEGIYINEVKADPIVRNILKELDDVSVSLQKINIILNRSVNIGVVKGNKANTFKSWARKGKEQANNALKLKEKLSFLTFPFWQKTEIPSESPRDSDFYSYLCLPTLRDLTKRNPCSGQESHFVRATT